MRRMSSSSFMTMSLPRMNAFLSLVLLLWMSVSVVAATFTSCRSNETHIAWTQQQEETLVAVKRRRLSSGCVWQTRQDAEQEAYRYLRQHVMQFDLPYLETLGFEIDEQALPDGLDGGLIGPTIQYALEAKVQFHYTDQLPKTIWQEYVLNYANTNEARSNWRPFLWMKLRHIMSNVDDISKAVHVLNTQMYEILAPGNQDSIVFKASETPLIFDTMSVLTFGHASCTGLAILFVNALRTMGVPARVVGTPAWHQNASNGNHNWVEVWKDQWYFLEPSPAQATIDTLERNPCERWFCNSNAFTSNPRNTTHVFAARLESSSNFYPLAWETTNQDVPGEDVSKYYQSICGQCP